MISHVHIGLPNLQDGMAFYGPVLQTLGWRRRFVDDVRGWAGWQPAGAERPLFLIGLPEDGNDHSPGNGQMSAFDCASANTVIDAYVEALSVDVS